MQTLNKIYRKYLISAICLVAFVGAQTYMAITASPQVQVSAHAKANAIKWGGSTWILANDGELVLADGDIGSRVKNLADTIKDAGLDSAAIKSIEFTQDTSASDVEWMLAKLPNLQKITGMKYLKYSGTAKGMFGADTSLSGLDLDGFDTSKITNMGRMFNNTNLSALDLSTFNTSNVTSMEGMFSTNKNLKNLNVAGFNTSKVSNMAYMFNDIGITKINLSSFDTRNVTSMEGMFDGAWDLTNLDITNFNTSKVTSMSSMFVGLQVTELDVTNFDTSNVVAMDGMFDREGSLVSLDVTNFDTSKVRNMSNMFTGTTVTKLDVTNFNTSNVTNMEGMFNGTIGLTTLDVTGFDTSKVKNMKYMFLNLKVKALDLTSFDTKNVTNMQSMFSGAIERVDLSTFTIKDSTSTNSMFGGANQLRQLTLGKETQLKSDMNIHDVPSTGGYSGHWQNVNGGTVETPTGKNIWTSKELMSKFDAATMGDDTYVWQKASGDTISIGKITDYADDPDLTKYVSTATHPVHPYRYNVVLNNEYSFYSKLEEGQHVDENTVELGDKVGATVYNKNNARITYLSGDNQGKTVNFVQVSFDGKTWYWVDEHALNLDLASKYPSVNKEGHPLLKDVFLGSTITFGNYDWDVNSQMIGNAYNSNGKIVYKSLAKESDFTGIEDSATALKVFNKNLDRAAKSWNDAIGQEVFIKVSDTDAKTTLEVHVNPSENGSATLSGETGISIDYVPYALDESKPLYEMNLLFIVMRHELGHNLGLEHTKGGQYYGMPDGYSFSIDDAVMNAGLIHTPDGYPWTQKTITENSVNAVKLILANHNFQNPQHSQHKKGKNTEIRRKGLKSYEITRK